MLGQDYCSAYFLGKIPPDSKYLTLPPLPVFDSCLFACIDLWNAGRPANRAASIPCGSLEQTAQITSLVESSKVTRLGQVHCFVPLDSLRDLLGFFQLLKLSPSRCEQFQSTQHWWGVICGCGQPGKRGMCCWFHHPLIMYLILVLINLSLPGRAKLKPEQS